jgi:hypothetical protein
MADDDSKTNLGTTATLSEAISRAYESNNKAGNHRSYIDGLNISQEVSQHIPTGSSTRNAISVMVASGFTISEHRPSDKSGAGIYITGSKILESPMFSKVSAVITVDTTSPDDNTSSVVWMSCWIVGSYL